jgi:hypothetical protein
MRHKMGDDFTGHYEPCTCACDYDNPIDAESVSVGVLICNDIELHARTLTDQLDRRDAAHKILCIPAHMRDQWFGSGALVYGHWMGKHVILANGNPFGCGSFISNLHGDRSICKERKNQLVLKTYNEMELAFSS